MTNERDTIRRVILTPYVKGAGPRFTLTVWDTGHRHPRGTTMLGYELREGREVLFAGEDFSASPMHADDSDASVSALLSFLTLRPGDTDAEYFETYTERQRRFCDEHAEALACEAERRFGDQP